MSLGLRRVLWIALGVSAVVLVALIDHHLARSHAHAVEVSRSMPPPVLLAKQFIPKGTPGSVVATNSM